MTVLVVDVMNMAHRARHTYSLSHNGADTSVTYGVMRMMMSLIKKFKPVGVVMCWDGGTPQFRKRLVPSYKEGRKKHDDNDPEWLMFLEQVNELQHIFRYSGMLQVKRNGIEADDLIYHVTRMLVDNSIVVSNDDDLLQCVISGVSVWLPSKKVLITDANFSKYKGYAPFQHVCAKVLMGDSSDAIQGVRGIGPKTVVKLLANDNGGILQACSPKMRERLQQFIKDGSYNASYSAIDLSIDMSGARKVIIDATWRRYSKRLYMWCIKNGFTSIIEAAPLGKVFGSLHAPEFEIGSVRFPVVWDYKRHG